MEEMIESQCDRLRAAIFDVEDQVRSLLTHSDFDGEQAFAGQHREMRANLNLSYRHLEDARMRLGKVMQQIQGGTSKFDK